MFLSTVVGGLFSAPGVGGAQPAGRIARVGYLASVPRAESVAIQVFVAKLSEMGFIEGQNLVIEFRHGDSQVRLRALAAELIGLGVQVIHAANPYALQAAREVTTTVPIVGYDLESDPVAAGFAASLARPGGNITGVFLDQPEVSGKLLQFLTEMVPGLSRVGCFGMLLSPRRSSRLSRTRHPG
jgi:putative ABC transport system substrate-binding protein